ncbi:MAG: hypothetical protein ACYC3L_16570 [Gemmatimonadaceae bacterium]
MRSYAQVSGAFLGFIALAQFARFVMRLPVQVAGYEVPVWWSGCAFVALAALAVWAFRTARRVT